MRVNRLAQAGYHRSGAQQRRGYLHQALVSRSVVFPSQTSATSLKAIELICVTIAMLPQHPADMLPDDASRGWRACTVSRLDIGVQVHASRSTLSPPAVPHASDPIFRV